MAKPTVQLIEITYDKNTFEYVAKVRLIQPGTSFKQSIVADVSMYNGNFTEEEWERYDEALHTIRDVIASRLERTFDFNG